MTRTQGHRELPGSGDALGGRLPLAGRSALSEPQRQLYDRMTQSVLPWAERAGFASQASGGRFIGPFNAALQSPAVCGSFLQLKHFAVTTGAAAGDPGRRCRVALGLRAVRPLGSGPAGLPEPVVRALAAGQLPGELSAAGQAAWRFTHQLTTQRRVEQPVYDQTRAAFGVTGITDMLSLIGAYQAVCGILNAFEIPAPETDGV